LLGSTINQITTKHQLDISVDYHHTRTINSDATVAIIALMNLNKTELPAMALYKSNCHHSTHSWLAYQAAPNEVRLLNFASDGSIKEVYILDVYTEPLQAIRLAFDK
jgi:hypothetical protein